MSDVCTFEFDGEEYELKYSFKMIRRFRNDGINVPAIHRAIADDPNRASDYADDIVSMAAILLRESGAKVTEQELWHTCNTDQDAMVATMQLFWWIIANHYAQPQGVKKHSLKKT